MFNDAIGREHQLATVQLDFNLPERFDLSFTNEKVNSNVLWLYTEQSVVQSNDSLGNN